MTSISQKQFLFAVFSETLPDGTKELSIETSLGVLRSADIEFSSLASFDIKVLNRLLKGERIEGIHNVQMQSLAERGIVHWTSDGWRMTEELRRIAAVEMLGKE
jgi:hypothetical protein